MKKILSLLIVAAMVASLLAVFPSAGSKIDKEVSLLYVRKNESGSGWVWDNIHNTLTLSGVYIDTEDDFGIKLPTGESVTVVLKGTNRIKGSKAALYIGGKTTIKGNGTLILEGGEYGVFCNSTDKRDVTNLALTEGKYEITAGKSGFFSAIENISLSSCDINIKAGKYGIEGNTVKLSNGLKLKSNAPLYAKESLTIDAANVDVSALSPALVSDIVNLAHMKMSCGETYGNESTFTSTANWKNRKTSYIFGENVSVAVDIILFAFAIALVAAAMIVPKWHKKRKLEKILAEKCKK